MTAMDKPSAHHDPKVTKDAVNRLRSIEGHVRGIAKMVEDGEYCIDIVRQILAARAALEKVSTLLLERHLHTCAVVAIRGDDPAERERVIKEILDVAAARGAR